MFIYVNTYNIYRGGYSMVIYTNGNRIIKKVCINKAINKNGILFVTVPRYCGLEVGDHVEILKVDITNPRRTFRMR